jgi:hypothetical protein
VKQESDEIHSIFKHKSAKIHDDDEEENKSE